MKFTFSSERESLWRQHSLLFVVITILILFLLVGCGPATEDLEAVDYSPLPRDDWEVSTPGEQGLDPMLVAQLYHDAAELETLYGLLVVKNGHLIAEKYFNEGSVDELFDRASATKSFTSALVGLALDKGCLTSVDQKMVEFFPEFAGKIDDPRKEQITIRDLLQMRGGYPDEEYTPPYFEILYSSDNWHHVTHLVERAILTSCHSVRHICLSRWAQRWGIGIPMPMTTTWAIWESSFRLAIWQSSACCISTMGNTRGTRSFPLIGSAIHYKDIRKALNGVGS